MVAIIGATGNVGGKIAALLKKRDEPIRVIARLADHLQPLSGKNVTALTGDILDTDFLVKAFTGVDAAFVMIPPNATAPVFMEYADAAGKSIARALEASKVKHVVFLSSIGAELADAPTGPIRGLHHMEQRLNRIQGLNVVHMRAGYFMENLLWNVGLIRDRGIAGSALHGDLKIPMISTKDIAEYAVDQLLKRDFTGSFVHYLLGERDLTLTEATAVIGYRIGVPGLPYITFPYAEAEKGMVAMGLSPDMGKMYVEMSRAFNEGAIKAEIRTRDNTTLTSIESFCDEVFVPIFTQQKVA